MEKKAPWWES